jgi:hypothetical protein
VPKRQSFYSVPQYLCTFVPLNNNGDDRARTDNLRLAKPALSQLSYVPGTTPVLSSKC